MTREEAIKMLKSKMDGNTDTSYEWAETVRMAIKGLEQQPCEMSVEEYRQRMIQAFHNADCDELIALVCLPTEQEFEHLEWLLKTFYNRPCEDCISREEAINKIKEYFHDDYYQRTSIQDCRDCLIEDVISKLPGVHPTKTGHWIDTGSGQECSECGEIQYGYDNFRFYCANCGAKIESEDEE